MKTLQNLEVKNIFLLIALFIMAVLVIRIFSPYFNIIVIALILVQIFQPIYRLIYKNTKSKAVSTLVSVITAIVLMVIPFIILILLTLTEITQLTQTTDILGNLGNLELSINGTIDNINAFLQSLNLSYSVSYINLQETASQLAGSVQTQLLPFVQQLLTLSGEILFGIFLLLICMIYFFPMYDRLPEIFGRISPLDKDLDQVLYQKFRATTKGVIKGSFFVAILQATAVIIPLVIINVQAPVLLWIIMVILSLLPIGSGLVWGPVGLFMILEGVRTGNSALILVAIALIIYSAVIINVIDTIVRPRIMKGTINIHPMVTIFSVLGGLYHFGPLGILYGPLIVVFFISIIDIYHKKFLGTEDRKISEEKPLV